MAQLVHCPVTGRVKPLREVPDPAFSEAMLGHGIALDPADGVVYSPISGRVMVIQSHGFVISPDTGYSILVHLGVDTKGADMGFTPGVSVGHSVLACQEILRWNPTELAAGGTDTSVSVIALESVQGAVNIIADGDTLACQPLFEAIDPDTL